MSEFSITTSCTPSSMRIASAPPTTVTLRMITYDAETRMPNELLFDVFAVMRVPFCAPLRTR